MDAFLEIQADAAEEASAGDGVSVMQMILREIHEGRPRLAQHAEAHLIKWGEAFLLAALDSAATDGYSIHCRVDRQDPGFRRLSHETAHARLASLIAGTPEYPLVLWLLPAQRAAGETAIHSWFADPASRSLLHAAIRAGGIWISVADIFLDVLTSAVDAPRVLHWLRRAERRSRLPIRWSE